MKKILILFVVFGAFAFSAIDECKTDVYFGNGILTEDEDARANARDVLKPAIIEKLGGLKNFNKRIGKVSYAYNSTHTISMDLAESLKQILDATFGSSTIFSFKIRLLLDTVWLTIPISPVHRAADTDCAGGRG